MSVFYERVNISNQKLFIKYLEDDPTTLRFIPGDLKTKEVCESVS